jgi:hypothetical protein
MPQISDLYFALDEFLPQEGHIYWYDREQPTNWGEDGETTEEYYVDRFSRIEAGPYVRGYFLLYDGRFILGTTPEEIQANELLLRGGLRAETFLEETPNVVYLGDTFEEALENLRSNGKGLI